MKTWSNDVVSDRAQILDLLNPACSPVEETVFRLLLEMTGPAPNEEEKVLMDYIVGNTPLGRSLCIRAKLFRPSLIVEGDAMEVLEILGTMDDAYILAEMFEDEEFGINPAVHHWKHCGGYATDSSFERLIEMAKRLERMRTLPRPERERIRVVRKCLEKEREMERYAKQRNA